MFDEALSYFLYFYGLAYYAIVPCIFPDQLLNSTVSRQQYLGNWYFKAAVGLRESDIRGFRAVDSVLFSMEEIANGTLLLTGHIRTGDECKKQTWTYHERPDRDDLELEGKPERRNLVWKLDNCADCIVFQEIEPPLDETGSEDSLSRFMLYTRQNVVDSKVVSAFVENAACRSMYESVRLPQTKGLPLWPWTPGMISCVFPVFPVRQ